MICLAWLGNNVADIYFRRLAVLNGISDTDNQEVCYKTCIKASRPYDDNICF